MNSDIAIKVDHLSKLYKIYNTPGDMVNEMLTGRVRHRPFWALRDVTFSVPRGHLVGIMGRNGAGKSTLLKIITGTLDATSGSVQVNGRISSILELGTGFSPEYTGRENVYVSGLMLGMSREDVLAKMDWIIDFSELRNVIDQPFKTYSTGMQARLTFSTAVCIEPEILIVDEALAVGDAKFARKCFGKIDEFRRAGRTILLVSHDVSTITNFCDHAILLENGQIHKEGEPFRISQIYYEMLFASTSGKSGDAAVENPPGETDAATPTDQAALREAQERQDLRRQALSSLGISSAFDQKNQHQRRIGNGWMEIFDFGILDANGNRCMLLTSGEKYRLFYRALAFCDLEAVTSGFVIRNAKGVEVYGTSTHVQDLDTISVTRGSVVEVFCDVTMWLANGTYFLSISAANPYAEQDVQYDMLYDAYQFDIRMINKAFTYSSVNLQAQPIERKILLGDGKFVQEDISRITE